MTPSSFQWLLKETSKCGEHSKYVISEYDKIYNKSIEIYIYQLILKKKNKTKQTY